MHTFIHTLLFFLTTQHKSNEIFLIWWCILKTLCVCFFFSFQIYRLVFPHLLVVFSLFSSAIHAAQPTKEKNCIFFGFAIVVLHCLSSALGSKCVLSSSSSSCSSASDYFHTYNSGCKCSVSLHFFTNSILSVHPRHETPLSRRICFKCLTRIFL